MKAGEDANTQETDETETNKVRTALEDFLTCRERTAQKTLCLQ